MRLPPRAARLPDGRLHLQDGPIDLIIGAFGTGSSVETAYRAAEERFSSILDELCAELPFLRARFRPRRPDAENPGAGNPEANGLIARRMAAAVAPFCAETFITPMAAVAGSVAQEILGIMADAAALDRAYVNNGGDIALHLAPGERFAIGMVTRPDRPTLFGRATVAASDAVRGIATSGRHGRSFSLGIADAVAVLAKTAAMADAAATIIANAVDLPGHAAIDRAPARTFDPQSDLGDRLVTIAVGPLTVAERRKALAAGRRIAERLHDDGLIEAAALHCDGETCVVGGPDAAISRSHQPKFLIKLPV